jgi:hypothetical protein
MAAEAAKLPAADTAGARRVCDQFMTAISKGRVAEAAALMKANWYKPEEADAVSTKFETEYRTEELRVEGDGSKMLGTYELVGARRWGASAIKFVCVQKLERSAVLWMLAFYQGAEDWKLAAFVVGPPVQEDAAALQVDVPPADLGPPGRLAEKFVSLLAAGLPNEAFAELRKSPWADAEASAFYLAKLEDQYRSGSAGIKKEIGVRIPGGVEFVAAKRLGASVLHLVYNEKREQGFLMWQLTFYKTQNEWKLDGVSFGGDIPAPLRSSAAVDERAP